MWQNENRFAGNRKSSCLKKIFLFVAKSKCFAAKRILFEISKKSFIAPNIFKNTQWNWEFCCLRTVLWLPTHYWYVRSILIRKIKLYILYKYEIQCLSGFLFVCLSVCHRSLGKFSKKYWFSKIFHFFLNIKNNSFCGKNTSFCCKKI